MSRMKSQLHEMEVLTGVGWKLLGWGVDEEELDEDDFEGDVDDVDEQ